MADKDTIPETPAAPPSSAAPSSDAPASQAADVQPVASAADAAGASTAQPESSPSLLQEVVAARDAKEQPAATEKAPEAKASEGSEADKKTAEPAVDAKAAEPPKDAAKPDDKKADEKKPDAKAAEAKPDAKATEAPKAPEPVEYKYTLPETIKLDDATKTKAHAAFDAFRADPTNPQPLIDFHNQAMTDYAKHLDFEQRRIFNETRKTWRSEIMADPNLGGAGHQTASQAIARMRDMLADPADLKPRKNNDGSDRMCAFDEMCEVTGVGDHPAFWRLLHNAARYLDEPQASDLPTNPRPTRVRAPRGGLYSEESRAKMNGRT